MIKVLHICTVPLGNNGISTVIYNYLSELSKYDFQVDILTIKLETKNIEKKFSDVCNQVFVFNRNSSVIKYMCRLIKICKNYDIVHVHGNGGTMAFELVPALIAKCKVRIAHCHSRSCKYKFLHTCLKPVMNILSTKKYACSDMAGKWAFFGKYDVLYNAFDIDKFKFSVEKREKVRKKIGVKDSDVLLGHVGGFNDIKNQDYLIDILELCLKQNDFYKLVLVGTGRNLPIIQEKCKKRKIEDKVIFYGTTQFVQDILSAMDIFLFPSQHEGLGISLIEAEFSGLQCIASCYVPRETNLNKETEYLPIDQNSIQKWVDCIEKLKNERKDRDVVLNNIDTTNYNIREQIKKLQQDYLELVNK